MSANLNAAKNSRMGKKSSSSFIEAELSLGRELERGRVHAVAQAGVGRPVLEHVPQMRAALRAHGFRADHAVTHVADFLDCAGHGLVEARPAAVRVELGA